MNFYRILGFAQVLGAVILTSSCGLSTIGKDSVLFVTRTNVAIDLDTVPATTDIGYKRDELVLGPIDEEGKVLPVLTSVGTSASPLKFGANHSFATGDAALMMSKYLGKPADLKTEDEISLEEIWKDGGSPGTLSALSTIGPTPISGGLLSGRLIFGTNTTLGLGVSWTSQYVPTAVSLGYKRKELAFIPLSGPVNKQRAIASLLATAHARSNVGNLSTTEAIIGQTFATGYAATLLASHPIIRAAIAPAIAPITTAEVREAEKEATKAKENAIAEQAEAGVFDAENGKQDELIKDINQAFVNYKDPTKEAAVISHAVSSGLVASDTDAKKFPARIRLSQDGTPDTTKKIAALRDTLPH